MRLYAKRALTDVAGLVLELQRVLLDRAAEAGPAYLPGYTHLQRAQPVLLAHHLLAHGWALARDVDRLLADAQRGSTCRRSAPARWPARRCPLDPDGVADDLGFARRFENSLDAVSDRDFVAEALFDLALLGVHLSRMGEEIVLWSSEEFGFLVLADAYATGSSMLPQKKNPDIAELVRGKAGRLIGHLTGRARDAEGPPARVQPRSPGGQGAAVRRGRHGATGVARADRAARTATFVAERMQASADVPDVGGDRPGRAARRARACRSARRTRSSARLVRDSIERRVPLAELVAAHPDLGDEALELLEPGVAVTRRTHAGRRRSRPGRDPARPLPRPARSARGPPR